GPSRRRVGSSSRYWSRTASKLQRPPWWPSSTPGTSNGVAPSWAARSMTWSAGTNRNSAFGSMNFLISHGQATRSTFTRSRVIHFMSRLSFSYCHADCADSVARTRKGQKPNDRGDCDQGRFRQLLQLPEQSDGNERDQRGNPVADGALGENDHRARDRPDRRCGDAI